jgi:hypothetical protein
LHLPKSNRFLKKFDWQNQKAFDKSNFLACAK